MKNWSESLAEFQRTGQPHVLITVISTAGSTPRGVGSKMVVTGDDAIDSIGGGQLEFQAIHYARELLLNKDPQQQLQHFPLGATTAQCCGGHATVLFESYPAHSGEIVLFGAGHVAKALVTILQQLPVHIRWIDNRDGFFPAPDTLSEKVYCEILEDPVDGLFTATDNAHAHVLIMTHDHQLDYALAEAALKSDRFASVGVIGSKTKAARFRHRLQMRDVTEAQFDRFKCPVGLAEVAGKLPMEVAVSIAGSIISDYQCNQQRTSREGVPLGKMKSLFAAENSAEDAAEKVNK